MRIISGTLKGHSLKCPKGNATRPVLDQVKEAIFNILPPPRGLIVLDLFAGTGALGIEALSRGATEAVFIENDRSCADVLLDNLTSCGLSDQAYLIRKPNALACRLLRHKRRSFDWIFCDPPYDRGLVNQTLANDDFLALATRDTRLIVEHSPREIPETAHWAVTDERPYGQTRISFLRKSR